MTSHHKIYGLPTRIDYMLILSSNILKHPLCLESDPGPFAEYTEEMKGSDHAIKELRVNTVTLCILWGSSSRTLMGTKIYASSNLLQLCSICV